MKSADRDDRRDRMWPDAAADDDVTVAGSSAAGGARDADDSSDNPRLLAAMQEYLTAIEAGRRISRQEMAARYPDIADELAACLDGLAFVHSAAGKIRAGTNGPAEAPPEVDPATAEPLGDFKLIRQIGRGGMGVVYEATQISLGRRVAVKVLSFASALDARHIQRFRNEAQAAAQLHHTNIVPVYAVGCDRSVHFYAMQLIEGQSLAEVISSMRSRAGVTDAGHDALERTVRWTPPPAESPSGATPRSSDNADRSSGSAGTLQLSRQSGISSTSSPADDLTTLRTSAKRSGYFRTVAKLALQAAEALDYAHNLGVVHRDIKPANLLLDIRGNLWITDFGLAQFYADAADNGLTQTGDLIGTFRYMSPEQASGRAVVLDQRTDVYSLGTTLYELLTLERALPGRTWDQLMDQIKSVEPRRPRSIDPSIPPELETIVAKATAKDASDRYPTARALADDLGRFLRDEPIRARPPSLWDRSTKWARRHRAIVLTGIGMLVLATAGLLVSTLLIARAQSHTRDAYEQERLQRARADKRYAEAREAVDFLTGIAANEMEGPQFTELRVKMLEASLAYYQRFLDERKDDPAAEADLSAARSRAWTILAELSAFSDVGRVSQRASLVSYRSVQEALGVSSEQARTVQRITEGLGARMWKDIGDLKQLTPDQRRERFTQIAADVESGIGGILTTEQSQRLRQIARQVKGPAAFSDSDVADALTLSRDQKEKIRVIQTAYQSSVRELFIRTGPGEGGGPRGPRDGGDGGRRDHDHDRDRPGPRDGGGGGFGRERSGSDEARTKLQKEAMDQILAELSPSQLTTWQALIGEAFTGKIPLNPFGGPGFGPGRGPPPG